MRSVNWLLILTVAALLGVAIGYTCTLIYRPTLIPPALRIGSIREPETILLLGVDVSYTDLPGRKKKIDQSAFDGRTDTIMVARLDPMRNSLSVLSIPRDTEAQIPGNGVQKINSANAIGGVQLAKKTVENMLSITIDHYIVLNVHGLVELVNELGGITVQVPKKMRYMDWTAKLKIDLEPGPHTLTGNQAMGFVRFRHDALGDIGRVQRQQIFMRAVLEKALQPESWSHLPKLMSIAENYILTDLSPADMMELSTFARAVPKANQSMVLMPGQFAGNGDWVVSQNDVRRMVRRMMGSSFVTNDRPEIRVTVENQSSVPTLGRAIVKKLRAKGYQVIVKQAEGAPLKRTHIIAQRANPEDAELVRSDLGLDHGEITNASVGDIESAVTVQVGDDLQSLSTNNKQEAAR